MHAVTVSWTPGKNRTTTHSYDSLTEAYNALKERAFLGLIGGGVACTTTPGYTNRRAILLATNTVVPDPISRLPLR